MKISYTSRSQMPDMPSSRRGGKSRNFDVIATVVVVVILVGAVIYWFIYSRASKTEIVPTPAPVVLPKELIERPFNAADGLKQCEKLTPTLSTQAEKDKRAKCYAAVMTVFGTTDICTAASLDSVSASLCAAAQASYEQTHPALPTSRQNPSNTNSSSAINTILNRNTNTNSLADATPGSTGTTKPGTQTNTTPQPGTSTTGTSTTSLSPPTTPPTTPTQPDVNPSTTPGETTSNPPSAGSTTTALELCIIDPQQLVLLQHTNECQ